MAEFRESVVWILKGGFEEQKLHLKQLTKNFNLRVFDNLESLREAFQNETELPHLVLMRPLAKRLMADLEQKSKFEWNPLLRKISRAGKTPVELTNREFQIFSALFGARNRKMNRKTLVSMVWWDTRVGVKTLDVHLFNLRKKLSQVGFEIVFSPPDIFTLKEI